MSRETLEWLSQNTLIGFTDKRGHAWHHQWERIVKELIPMPDDPTKSKRAATVATRKRDTLMRLWRHDERVAPWSGTAFGAWQAFNTYGQHEATVRGMSRQERNMLNAVNGTIESADADTVRRILALTA